MPYPDTTRTALIGIEAVERTPAATLWPLHTMGEPAHTLQNGIIIPRENTGTRVKDNGQSRGKRSSSLRLTGYIRLDEIGYLLESAIAAGTSVAYPNYKSQVATITGTPTGGDFTLTYAGQTTTAIAFDAAAAAVQAALEALSNVAPGDIVVTGSAGGPYTLAFAANLADNWIPVEADGSGLTGGTTPDVVMTATTSVTGVYRRTYLGGVARGKPITVVFFNGLYWRRISGGRVNTLNIQGFGNALATFDMEVLGPASSKISAPTVPEFGEDYNQVAVPMPFVRFAGTVNADVDRMAININNNLTFRSTMDGTTSAGRTRVGDFDVALDGMADYPVYEGSLYEAFELNNDIESMDFIMMDDLMDLGTGTGSPVNPYLWLYIPRPVLGDTAEGDDGGELVQMIRGRAQYANAAAASLVAYLVNDKPGTDYQGT
jgi:hypothetical protein